MVGGLLVDWLYGVDVMGDPAALSDLQNPSVIAAMKLLQMLTTGIGMFIVPSLIASLLFHERPLYYLRLTEKVNFNVLSYTILIMFAVVPLINVLMVFNQQLHLPEFLSSIEEWMKSSEANAARITEVFLIMNSPDELLYNLLIIAVLPAIGEEFLFRGVLQRLFHEMTNNIHVTILITAALFSAIHMQFYGFLPRMVLGVLFGYLMVWTGSIWVPVLAHFVNNGAAVLFAYFAGKNQLPFNQDTVGTEEGHWHYTIISIALVAVIGYMIKKSSPKTSELPQ